MIVRCADASDVRHAVGFARSEGLDVAVRGGGHSIPGFSTCDGGIVIDLSPMKGIEVDVAGRTAVAEGGLTWGEFDAATQEHGLAVTGGLVSTTGVAGFTLGGGIGWLMRKHGLACDNLRSAEVVTADGQLVTASADREPGPASGACAAAAATSASSPPSSSTCTRSARSSPPARSSTPASGPRRSCASIATSFTDIPDELTTLANLLTAPPAPFLPEEWHGKKLVALIGCYAGDPEEGAKAMQPLRELGDPVADLIGPMPYVADAGPGRRALPAWDQGLLEGGLPARASTTRRSRPPLATTRTRPLPPRRSTSTTSAARWPVSTRRRAPTASARRPSCSTSSPCRTSRGLDTHIDWAQRLYAEIEPSLTGGAYINFLSAEGEERVKAAYGAEKFARLQALKDRYDPTNLFHLNQNVPPTSAA